MSPVCRVIERLPRPDVTLRARCLQLVAGAAALLAFGACAIVADAQPSADPVPAVVVYGGDRGFAPFEYLDSSGDPAGFNVELIRELGRLAGVRVEVRLGVWRDVIADLDAGRVDLMSLALSDRRAERYSWVARTWTLSQALVYAPNRLAPPSELDELERETVAVESRSLMHELLQELPEVRRPALIVAPSQQDALRLLLRGDATAVAGNSLMLRRGAAALGVDNLVFTESKALSYGFATRKGHEAALGWIEPALADARDQGMFDRLVERHLADAPLEPSWQRIITLARVTLPVVALAIVMVVLWNWSLRGQVRARQAAVERTVRLQAVTQALANPLHTSDVAAAIVAEATRSLRAYGGMVAMKRPGEPVLDVVEIGGYTSARLGSMRSFAETDRLPAALAARTGQPVFVETPEQLAAEYPLVAEASPSRAVAALPLVAGGHTFGVIGLSFREPRVFTPEDRGLAMAIARQSALAFERARLYEAERAARADAEAASRAKDEFLATLSHELRTPLNAILGWSHMLRSGILPGDRVARALDTIERNAQIQVQLIGDLLDVSRAVRGTLVLDPANISLRGVVEAAVDSMRPVADAGRVALVTHLPQADGVVWGDAARLQQVFGNLLSNAIKFTPSGGRVDITLEVEPHVMSVSVRDTGEGIDAERLPHVFERFYQGDASTTREHGGLGIGLAIVRHVVEQHGGTVEASSGGRGQGSQFIVRLPRLEARAAATDEIVDTGVVPSS